MGSPRGGGGALQLQWSQLLFLTLALTSRRFQMRDTGSTSLALTVQFHPSGFAQKMSPSPALSHLPSQVPVLSSHKAKYLDTRKALRNWWIFFPLFHLRCLTPASLEFGPVPSAAGLRGAELRLCTEPVACGGTGGQCAQTAVGAEGLPRLQGK